MPDYAVVVMGQLASRPDHRQSATSIAEKTGIPQATVGQVLKSLSIAELVDGTRGAQGGYILCHPASKISVAEIVVAMDGPVAITACV
ncbi:MAG: Rrf2 family transcriptional regulator, partial [Rhodospirillales bacterium]